MSDLNLLFRNRVGIPNDLVITFENLDMVLEKTAETIPFENLCIIKKKTTEITKKNLLNKIIFNNEGGICYELNSIFFYFLLENGLNASLVRGVVYDNNAQQWNTMGKTHVANVMKHNGQLYIIDTGFGGNLPLKPVPFTGETITSNNGEFRVKKEETDYGDYIFYMKLKNKDNDWKKGYAFDSKEVFNDVSMLNEVQNIILKHPDSPFNKRPLITRLTDRGNETLTETSFTKWEDGNVHKEEIDQIRFKEILKEHFGIESH
ncbi:arylamine N-acetyltransferase [Neobacillus pocheonensis]|uniref:arylamine N-acetyltransferase family protein n=1 Tax=Neobacillus pocheonensis TaxID=363869 RepID=UPI003D265456